MTISFQYDPGGNRVGKTVISSAQTKTTWYVRDAQGNVISTYDNTVRGTTTTAATGDSLGDMVALADGIFSFYGNNSFFVWADGIISWVGTDGATASYYAGINDWVDYMNLLRGNPSYLSQFGSLVQSTFNTMPTGFNVAYLTALGTESGINRFRQGELYLYGSKRLGVMNVNRVFNDNSSSAYINPFNGMPFLWSVAGINNLPHALDSTNPHFMRGLAFLTRIRAF